MSRPIDHSSLFSSATSVDGAISANVKGRDPRPVKEPREGQSQCLVELPVAVSTLMGQGENALAQDPNRSPQR